MRSLVFELRTRLRTRSGNRKWKLASALLLGAIFIFGRKEPQLSLLGFYPPELNFGDQQVGVPSTIQRFTLVNLGNTPADVRTAMIVGEGAFTKKEDMCSGVSLAVHASCTIGIEFVPTKKGPQTADLLLATGFDKTQYKASVSGDGTQDETIDVTPHQLKFPDQEVNSQSGVSVVTVTNRGNMGLTFKLSAKYDPNGEFRVSGDCLEKPMQPDQTRCILNLRFAPNSAGRRQGFLVIRETNKSAKAAAFSVDVLLKSQRDQEGQHVVPMNGNGTRPKTVDLTVETFGRGQVVSSPPGIDCPSKCKATFTLGKSVELRSSWSDGWKFGSWSGACAGAGGLSLCNVATERDALIGATFEEIKIPRTLTVRMLYQPDANAGCEKTFDGRIGSSPTGLLCAVSSHPSPVGRVGALMVAPRNRAWQQRVREVPLSNQVEQCVGEFSSGETIKLTAETDAPTRFIGYGGDCKSPSKTCDVLMDNNKVVTATFCAVPLIQ